MEKIRKHFDSEADVYDALILTLIPYYREMTDALIGSIPFDNEKAIKTLDLGCGTGNISEKLKKRFPNSQITCVDMAEKMLKIAKNKLKNYSGVFYKLSDFQNLVIEDEYHVIISSLALHHLENNETKYKFYEFIYNSLQEGGVFYNADLVLGSNEYLQEFYLNKWKEFMNKNYSHHEIEHLWLPLYHQEDRPAELITQIQWLKQVGFRQVDVVWKYYNLGVYGGIK